MLPEKTVERLSGFRRTLLNCLKEGKTHIYSHELAKIHNITAVQVRRDIMFIGYSTSQKKGYDIKALVEKIGEVLDKAEDQNVGVVGMGNLGKAVTGYFVGKRPKLKLIAAFDIDPKKFNRVISGIKCYPFENLEQIVKEQNIAIVLLAVPPDSAQQVAEKLAVCGIKGILNFTSVPLNLPPNVYIEEYDMITSLEKVAYFVKWQQNINNF
ncbi:MAG: redox-sensing transcriptional repressor Rex [Bacteroidota bacterium]